MQRTDPTEIYKEGLPPFGKGLKKYFPLDPEFLYLNHGSFGAVPNVVHELATNLNLEIEANPDKFIRLKYRTLLQDVRQKLADLVGAKRDEIVLVHSASVGINTVLRNFDWDKDDIIIHFNTTFPSIHQTAQNLSDMAPHPTLSEIKLAFPTTHADIIDLFKKHVKDLPKPPGKKRVAIIDSIAAMPAALLPWKELVQICKDNDILSVIDGAHSVGQEVGINLTQAAPDFWVSNCHKWLNAKRGCAMLYIPERNRKLMKTALPTSSAYYLPSETTDDGFMAQWDWNGTINPIPFLVVKAAMEFREQLGGEKAINDYCHKTAVAGGAAMAEILGTEVMDSKTHPGEFTLNMVNVRLPVDPSIPPSENINTQFMTELLEKYNAYSVHYYHNGHWWTRCSANVYNDVDDFKNLANIWKKICQDLKQKLDQNPGGLEALDIPSSAYIRYE